MPYTKQTWINGEVGDTPLNATRLDYMEEGIEDATITADAAAAGVSGLDVQVGVLDAALDSLTTTVSGHTTQLGTLTTELGDVETELEGRLSEASMNDNYIPREIPDTAQIISTFLGNGQVFWEDHDHIPIFAIPAAGGPRVFGDNMGAWCGVFDKAIEFTPWGSLKFGDVSTKQLFMCTGGPLDAETIDQMERMGDGGRSDAIAEVGDVCISMTDERLLWRCITAGTPGTAGSPQGSWVPALAGSSIKSITNHSATGSIQSWEQICYCWNTITVTLPDPSSVIHGREYTVKNAGSGTVTVAAHSGSIIEGAATKDLTAGQFARFVGITSGWILV